MTGAGSAGAAPLTWRELLAETTERLGSELDARRIVEHAAGRSAAELALGLDEPATTRAVAHLDAMVERRAGGEPLQYVVGRWGFRQLELYVDRRVLIPRPETEVVAGVAVDELRALAPRGRRRVAVDLGTGSGAIALALAWEVEGVEVWGVDRSADALAVARANLAGLGGPAARVRLVEGSWYEALPPELCGRVDVIVANPPYVAEGDELPREVADWEPAAALVAGPTGLECLAEIVAGAPGWLARPGALVCELAPHQAAAAADLARAAGFGHVEVRSDLTGRERVLLARSQG